MLVEFEIEEVLYVSDTEDSASLSASDAEVTYLGVPYAIVSCKYESFTNRTKFNNESRSTPSSLRFFHQDAEESYTIPHSSGVIDLSGHLPYLQPFIKYRAICDLDMKRRHGYSSAAPSTHQTIFSLVYILTIGVRPNLRIKDLKYLTSSTAPGMGRNLFHMVCLAYGREKAKHLGTPLNTKLSLEDPFHPQLLTNDLPLREYLRKTMDVSGWNAIKKYKNICSVFPVLSALLFRLLDTKALSEMNGDLVKDRFAWLSTPYRKLLHWCPWLSASMKYTLWFDLARKEILQTNPAFFKDRRGRGEWRDTKDTTLLDDMIIEMKSDERSESIEKYTRVFQFRVKLKSMDVDEMVNYIHTVKDRSLFTTLFELKCACSMYNRSLYFRSVEKESYRFYETKILPMLDASGETLFKSSELQQQSEEQEPSSRHLEYLECLREMQFIKRIDPNSLLLIGPESFQSPDMKVFASFLVKRAAEAHASNPKQPRGLVAASDATYTLAEFQEVSERMLENIRSLPEAITEDMGQLTEYSYLRGELMFGSDYERISQEESPEAKVAGKPLSYWSELMELDATQVTCLNAMVQTPLTMVVALPGRGKTVVIEAMYLYFGGHLNDRDSVAVVTHGGCMAANLRERGILKAKTICKLLEDGWGTQRRPDKDGDDGREGMVRDPRGYVDEVQNRRLNNHQVRLLIIDEASNVSEKLMAQMTSRCVFPNLERIVLVMDVTQTLPLEPGSPAIDLVKNTKRRNAITTPMTSFETSTVCVLGKSHRYENALSTNCFNDECMLNQKPSLMLFCKVSSPQSLGKALSGEMSGEEIAKSINNSTLYGQIMNSHAGMVVNTFYLPLCETSGPDAFSKPQVSELGAERKVMTELLHKQMLYVYPYGEEVRQWVIRFKNANHLCNGDPELTPNWRVYHRVLVTQEKNVDTQILSLSVRVRNNINNACDDFMGEDPSKRVGRSRAKTNTTTPLLYLGQKVVSTKNAPSVSYAIKPYVTEESRMKKILRSVRKGNIKRRLGCEEGFLRQPPVLDRFDLKDVHGSNEYYQTKFYNGKCLTFLGMVDLYVGELGLDEEKVHKCLSKSTLSLEDEVLHAKADSYVNRRRWLAPDNDLNHANPSIVFKHCSKNPFKKMIPFTRAYGTWKYNTDLIKRFLFFTDGSRICINNLDLRSHFQPGWCITTNSAQGREYTTTMLVMEKCNAHSVFGLRHAHVALTRAKKNFILLGEASDFITLSGQDTDLLHSRRTLFDLMLKNQLKQRREHEEEEEEFYL